MHYYIIRNVIYVVKYPSNLFQLQIQVQYYKMFKMFIIYYFQYKFVLIYYLFLLNLDFIINIIIVYIFNFVI